MLESIYLRVRNRLSGGKNYREALFEDLLAYCHGYRLSRVLEIGPKDGLDTARLLSSNPDELVLIDLPGAEGSNSKWLEKLPRDRITYISANLMYDPRVQTLDPFDCVWCTGVLYHNPEQLRMIRRLYDLLKPGGILVLETATARTKSLRNLNCVEVVYPPSEEYKRKHHVSLNITHLPSRRAVASWLEMVGFSDLRRSDCHRRHSYSLSLDRVAYLCRRSEIGGRYYALAGNGYAVGASL